MTTLSGNFQPRSILEQRIPITTTYWSWQLQHMEGFLCCRVFISTSTQNVGSCNHHSLQNAECTANLEALRGNGWDRTRRRPTNTYFYFWNKSGCSHDPHATEPGGQLTDEPLGSTGCHGYVGSHGGRFGFLCGHGCHAAAVSVKGNVLTPPSLDGARVPFRVLSPVPCGRGPAGPGLGLIETLSALTLPAVLCTVVGKHDLVHMAARGPQPCSIPWVIKVSVPKGERLPAPLVLDGLDVIMGAARARRPAPPATVSSVQGGSVPLVLGKLLRAGGRDHGGCSIQAPALRQWRTGTRRPTGKKKEKRRWEGGEEKSKIN